MVKSLSTAGAKADAARVKALVKPTVIPWAVNQVYWRARSIWDRLLESGQSLRASQLAALAGEPVRPGGGAGRAGGVARAGRAREDFEGAHRRAVADAVHQAVRAAADVGAQPAVDQLTRMLEAISLAVSSAEPPGRFTELVQPAGFEALLGVTIAPPSPHAPRSASSHTSDAPAIAKRAPGTSTGREAKTHAKTSADAVDAARRAAAAEALADARRTEEAARHVEAAATQAVHDAELRLKQAKAALADAQAATRAAIAAREKAEQRLK